MAGRWNGMREMQVGQAKSRTARLQQQEDTRRAIAIHDGWAKRHPQLAREERTLRKANIAVREKFGHKVNGTPETHAKASRTRQGALARLYEGGVIDVHQLAAAVSIATVHARITSDVTVSTASFETRVDTSRQGGRVLEKLGAVRAEATYSLWRQDIDDPAVVLAMIVDDIGVNEAARRFGMRKERAKSLLIAALNRWDAFNEEVRNRIDPASLAAAQAGIF